MIAIPILLAVLLVLALLALVGDSPGREPAWLEETES